MMTKMTMKKMKKMGPATMTDHMDLELGAKACQMVFHDIEAHLINLQEKGSL